MEFKSRVIVPSVVAALCMAATSAMAQVGEIPDRGGLYNHGHDMMWGGSQWGGFGMVLGPIFMILIVVGIVAGSGGIRAEVVDLVLHHKMGSTLSKVARIYNRAALLSHFFSI
jgi:hypothetical protein